MVRKKGQAAVEGLANRLEKLAIVYVGIDEVKPNAYNPNRQSEHDFELLKKSMTEDGFTQPIIVHRDTKEIVDGEHRWRASRALGYDEVPVVFVDFTPEQMRISTLRHNRARGSEDIELSAQVLRDLRELGALDYAQDQLMLDDVELQALLDDTSAAEGLGAAAEFGEAWEPDAHRHDASVEATGGDRDVSLTPVAADRQREIEKRLSEARTREERESIRRESDTYRIVAIFAGDEAETVKQVLGDQAAARILHLCREAVERGDTFLGTSTGDDTPVE